MFDSSPAVVVQKSEWQERLTKWRTHWLFMVKQSPEAKTERIIALYDVLWYATNKTWEVEKREEARKVVVQFFQVNPTRCMVDPGIWRELVGQIMPSTDGGSAEALRTGGMRVIENVLQEDLDMQKYNFRGDWKSAIEKHELAEKEKERARRERMSEERTPVVKPEAFITEEDRRQSDYAVPDEIDVSNIPF